ncbi:MAG: hypothetical protein LBL13_06295 [Bacteroidales bacterium]|jgi:hypothetical protein|nr:hypothetical protein [Bacteroidales bacterium]
MMPKLGQTTPLNRGFCKDIILFANNCPIKITIHLVDFKQNKNLRAIFFRISAVPMAKNCTFAARKFKNVNL